MMLQRLKTIGAPLAQTGLLQQRKNPTHGVVAGAANNAHPCVGAVLAQTASRVSHLTRYAAAALCLRRRSLPHRSSPVKRDLRARVANRALSTRSNSLRTCERGDHGKDRGAPHRLVRVAISDGRSLTMAANTAPQADRLGEYQHRGTLRGQQSFPLLASPDIAIDIYAISLVYALLCRCWEWHGKIIVRETPGLGATCHPDRPDHLSRMRGVPRNSIASLICDLSSDFRGPLSKIWAGPAFKNLGRHSLAARIRSTSHGFVFCARQWVGCLKQQKRTSGLGKESCGHD